MKKPAIELRILMTLTVLLCYTVMFVGCGPTDTAGTTAKTVSNVDDHGDDDHDHDHDDHDGDDHDHDHDDHKGHDHDDHDHDDHKHAEGDHDHGDKDHKHAEGEGHDHEGHDHPAHGPNGGHLLTLEPGDIHAEWAHVDEKDQIMVYVLDDADAVTKIEMKFQVKGQEPKVFEFEKAEADGKSFYQIESPELLTAVKMGKTVGAKLVVTTEKGELTGAVEHHAH